MRELPDCIELVGKNIAFEFLGDLESGGFNSRSRGGIIYRERSEDQVGQARWAKVIMVGPEVTEVHPDEFILIEPLRWTTALSLDTYDGKFWITQEKEIMAISDQAPEI